MTHWVLGEILFLQNLKRNIVQDKKVEERLVPLGISKKAMPHVFLKKNDISLAKGVIMGVRVSALYGNSLRQCFNVEDHLLRLKSHDHLNLL